jgi:hypothetical protein
MLPVLVEFVRSNKKTNPKSGRQPYLGSCNLCSSISTERWYRKIIPEKVICRQCYDKHRRINNPGFKEKRNKQNQEWQKTYMAACKLAKDKGMILELTESEWREKIKQCTYCGIDISNNTGIRLDRVDNSKGYTNSNTVGCCRQCNVAKNNYSLEEFREWVDKVYNNFFSRKD